MRTRTLVRVAAGVCLAAALACFAVAWRASAGERHLIPFQPARAAAQPSAYAPLPPAPASSSRKSLPAPVSAPPPVKVIIPAVGLSAPVVPVGLDKAGQIEMPSPAVAGWYEFGAAPGDPGPAVIVGHVDTYTGPAVFYQLTGVKPGDKVEVLRANGSRVSFVITKVTVVSKAAFPSKAVFGPVNGAVIRLVTCTGTFNPNTRHYLDSMIAWGQLTSSG